ncbi:hypothetical protein [Streptomyces sp. NPDC060205]|uniref:hypothetical protein n=1 Tax=Streptomyces sp. NPDC060205 TaxID=3347072 RepID=UPI00364D4344
MRERFRRRVWPDGIFTVVMATVLLLGFTPMTYAGVSAAAEGDAFVSAQSEAAQALAKASETGERVEVLGERSQDTTVYANTDGATFTLEQSAVPVRVATSDGGWQVPDATLVRRTDGTVAPKAAAVSMEFSGGGDDSPLARVEKGGQSLALGWLDTLPKPELDGTSAVYRDVLKDVDLKVTASVQGFRHVLVVRTPEAAVQPELERIEYSLQTSELSVVENNSGGYNAVDADGNWVFRAPRAQMWNSAGSGSTRPGAVMSAARAGDAAVDPGEGADDGEPGAEPMAGDTVKPMDVSVDEDSLTVTPDPALLTDTAEQHFPLYIDPTVTWGEAADPAALGRLRVVRLGQWGRRSGQGRRQVRYLGRLLLRSGLYTAAVLRVLAGQPEGQAGAGRHVPGDRAVGVPVRPEMGSAVSDQ